MPAVFQGIDVVRALEGRGELAGIGVATSLTDVRNRQLRAREQLRRLGKGARPGKGSGGLPVHAREVAAQGGLAYTKALGEGAEIGFG